MTLFIHAADVHLDSPLRGLSRYAGAPVEAVRGASRRALENLVDYVIDQGAPLLLIAGDLYDGDWKDFQTGLFIVQQLRRLQKHDVRVGLVRGNHDAENAMTKDLPLPENVHVFGSLQPETWIIEDLNMAVHGQSFRDKEEPRNLAADFPEPVPGRVNVGLLHAMAAGTGTNHQRYAPCSATDLAAKGYEYWALGHVHERQVINENPAAVYAGCLQARHIREPGAKGCVRVEVSPRRCSHEFVDMDVMRWAVVEADVSGAETLEQAASIFLDTLQNVLPGYGGRILGARAVLSGRCLAHSRLTSEHEALASQIRAMSSTLDDVWVEKVEVRTRPNTSLEDLAQSSGPLGELLQYLNELANDPEVFAALQPDFTDLKAKMAQAGVSLPHEATKDQLQKVRDVVLSIFLDSTEYSRSQE